MDKQLAEFVEKIDKAYEDFKNGIQQPLIENVTILLEPKDIEILKNLFVDGLQVSLREQNRDNIDLYSKLHRDIFFQLPPELMF